MQHVLNLSQPISFAPGTVAAEVLQNVRTILATRKGTVPLDRDFGLEWEHVDKPIHIAKALIQAEIIEAVEGWEPRAVIDKIEFGEQAEDAMDGLLNPIITLSIGGANA